jgi:hypothetical protein
MPTYRVVVYGTNLLMEVDGERGRYSVEVARFVEAADSDRAGEQALELVLASPQVQRGARNEADDPPAFHVKAVNALAPGTFAPPRQPGFAFYPEE